jgi:hypothetical protein
MLSVAPRRDDSTTLAPESGLFPLSRTVTVIVLADVPSAVTEAGAADTEEVEADELSSGMAFGSLELTLSCPPPKARTM